MNMAGYPNWWSVNPPSLIPPQYVLGSFNSLTENPEPSQPWSQLLFSGEEERVGFSSSHFPSKKFENWEEHILNPSRSVAINIVDAIKQESGNYGEFHQAWSHMVAAPAVCSPRSSVTSLSSNHLLDFTYNKPGPQHTSDQCNSTATATGAVSKKARAQPSSSQPPLKVRKEKLGDRITALHQLVSPFGKTDTASVLLEAIGYIRFLQGQIEALSSPYLGNASKNMRNQQPQVHGERNSVFPEDPGQLLNDTGLKRKGAPNQDAKDKPKDLRSRGLCLVPVSCTQHVGSENGADYWAPAYGTGF